jgi:hypothetical protein
MKLYEINNDILNLLENEMVVDEETGEVIWDADNFDSLIQNRDEKWENCGLFIKNLNAEIDSLKTEEKNLKQRRQAKEKKVQRLSDYLRYSMQLTDDRKFETARVVLSLRKSKRVEIDDIEKLPKEFIKEKVEVSADKTKLKDAIDKHGMEIDGARIVENDNLNIK